MSASHLYIPTAGFRSPHLQLLGLVIAFPKNQKVLATTDGRRSVVAFARSTSLSSNSEERVVGVFFFLLDEGSLRGTMIFSYYLSHVARRLAASQWRKDKKVWATGINVVRDRSTWRGYSITSDGLKSSFRSLRCVPFQDVIQYGKDL